MTDMSANYTSSVEGGQEVNHQARHNRYLSSNTRGAGFTYLKTQLSGSSDSEITINNDGKRILNALLAEHGISLDEIVDSDDEEEDQRPTKRNRVEDIQIVDTTMSDETILQLARQVPSKMSLLGSLLKLIHDDGGTVSTRAFLKICALSVRPGMVPAHMDAKEMVMAALCFLSSIDIQFDPAHPPAPWIRSVQETGDLEKRVYEKVGNWELADLLPAVVILEDVFYSSIVDLKWMPRARFCPDIANKVERDLLLLKGNPPTSCTKKIVRKKKVKSDDDTARAEPASDQETTS